MYFYNRVCTAVFIFKGGYSELVFLYCILPLAILLLVVCLNCVLSKYILILKKVIIMTTCSTGLIVPCAKASMKILIF